MQKINAKIKSYQDVWSGDKALVRLSHPHLNIDWDASLPNERDVGSILLAKSQQWQKPIEPFELNERSLADVVDSLLPEVEAVFAERLPQQPSFQILSRDRYMPRIKELEREMNALFGYGSEIQHPPTMYSSPYHNVVLIPEKYLVLVPKDSPRNVEIRELVWDRPFFEEAVCQMLSNASFRQMRGEWRENYVRSMKGMDTLWERQISAINGIIAQYVKETIARTKRSKWGLYVASEKIPLVWQNMTGMNFYLGVDALSKNRVLAQIAAVDSIRVVQAKDEVYISFHGEHPNYKAKEELFNRRIVQ